MCTTLTTPASVFVLDNPVWSNKMLKSQKNDVKDLFLTKVCLAKGAQYVNSVKYCQATVGTQLNRNTKARKVCVFSWTWDALDF